MARTANPHEAALKAWESRRRAQASQSQTKQDSGDWAQQAQLAKAHDELWDSFPEPPEGITAAEEAWTGGVADFGDRDAAYLVQGMEGYFDYRSEVEDRLRKVYGDEVTMYRSMSVDQYEEWRAGADIGPKSFSLVRDVAEKWSNFAAIKEPQVIVKAKVSPSAVVMRGKQEESELVMDGNQISFDTLEVLRSDPGLRGA